MPDAADGMEFVDVPGSPADQKAVDILEGTESGGLRRAHAPAVKDRRPGGHSSIVDGETAAEESVDLGDLGGLRGPPGPDGPERLVGEEEIRNLLAGRSQGFENRIERPEKHLLGAPGVPLEGGFPETENGTKPRGEGLADLAGDEPVTLPLIATPFGVADDDVAAAAVAQHAGGDRTGVRAVVLVGHVLSAEIKTTDP